MSSTSKRSASADRDTAAAGSSEANRREPKEPYRPEHWYVKKMRKCPRCLGKGELRSYRDYSVKIKCNVCDGTGKVTPI